MHCIRNVVGSDIGHVNEPSYEQRTRATIYLIAQEICQNIIE